jgi:hypothetical protein
MATAGAWGRGAEFGFFPERYPNAVPETQTSMVSYACSDDGFAWHKPELGRIEWQGSTRNNIVLDGSGAARQFDGALTNMDTISVIRDEEEPDGQKRYKLICHWETVHFWDNIVSKLERPDEYMAKLSAARAKYMATSPDGIRWDSDLIRIKECAGGGDYAGVTRDERNQRYWFNDRAPVGLPGMGWGYRSAGLCSSPDLEHWPETVEMVFAPGEHEGYGQRYQHHGMVPFNYGDQDLCMLEYSIGGAPVAAILGSHRDGERWRRANGHEPILEVGLPGAWDDTLVAATRNAPFRMDDRLLFFYNGRHTDKATGRRTSHISAATMRLDGFAALTVDPLAVRQYGAPAMLMMHLIEVREDTLQINISGHGGTAKVALLGPDTKPIPGYELEACQPIDENDVRAEVRWKSAGSLAPLKGRQVHVLVQMNAGSLYAMRL